MREKIAKFMYGRYGVDQLSRCILWIAVATALLSMFLHSGLLNLLTILLLVAVYVRMFSKNREKRYQENMRFLSLKGRTTSAWQNRKTLAGERKEFHIYTCPGCGQKVRVPKGKGKVEISCPKCKNRFVKRS